MIKFYVFLKTCCIAALLMSNFCMCKKKVSIAPNDIIETTTTDPVAVIKNINNAYGGYYVVLPGHYNETSKSYPVILFLHGAGQMGNGSTDLPYLLSDGIGKLFMCRV